MHKLLTALGLALITASLTAPTALACADKMRVLGRGVRYQQIASARPASILIYNKGLAVRDSQLQPALKRAGHSVLAVQDTAQLSEALKRGNYDVLVADVSDAGGLEELLRAAPSRPTLLPVVSDRSTFAEAAKRFQRFLKAPDKAGHYLTAVDDVMQLRSKAGSAKGSI